MDYSSKLMYYLISFSYPAIVVIPSKVADDTILKVAKNHKLNRFPVAIWRNKRTKGTLLRCGTVAKNILSAILRASLIHNRVQGNLNTNVTDDEKYFSEIGEQCCLSFLILSVAPLLLLPVKIKIFVWNAFSNYLKKIKQKIIVAQFLQFD